MKKMMKIRKAISLGALCLTVCAGIFFGGAYIYADANAMQTTDLFLPSQMQIAHSSSPEGVNSLEAGVMVTADSPKAKLSLRNETVGQFSYRFEPVRKAGVVTLKTFETAFTNENGESFILRIAYGAKIYASVVVDGVDAGLVYDSAGKLSGNTKYANSTGEFTSVTTGELSVIFDANTMEIFVGASGAETLVWNLSTPNNDGCDVGFSFLPFGCYNVEFAMTEYQGESCSVVFREFNDCALNGITLSTSGTPSISAAFTEYGVKGESYRLPEAVAADLWDGELQTTSEVFAPNGEKVAENAKRFTPKQGGEYLVRYSAENARGAEVVYDYELTVFENAPFYQTALSEDSFTGELTEKFVGDTLYIPEMTVSGGRYIYGYSKAKVVLQYNGVTLGRYNGVDGGFFYTFREAGKYTVSYAVGGGQTESYSVRVTVCETALSEKIQSEYDLDTVLNLSEVRLVVNNEQIVDCQIQVTYPDGSVYANEIFQCTQAGEYTVTASGETGGKEYRNESKFVVTEKLSDLFSYGQGISGEYGNSLFTNQPGYLLNFAKMGVKATYGKPIDLSTYTNVSQTNPTTGIVTVKEGAKALISLSIDPISYGVAAASEYFVHLTDAENPNNSITIVMRSMGYKQYTYICAKAGDQEYIGFHNSDTGKTVFHGQTGDWYTTRYGFLTPVSFYGETSNQTAENNIVTFYYDDEEKQLYAKPNRKDSWGWIICDFDDPAGCNGSPWKGFESGKAYISVECGTMTSALATIPVYAIDGNSFVTERLNYEDAPTVVVSETQIAGVKGYTVKVPEAKACDQYGGELAVNAKAYYKQGENRYDVKIKDGRFATEKSGEYVIVYTAKDAYGNIGTKEILVKVEESVPAISISLVDLNEEHTQGKTGGSISICDDLDAVNAIGGYTVSTTVTGIENLVVKNGTFTAEKAGVYVVTQMVTDSLGRTGSVSYEVTVEVDSNPVAISEIPAYFGFIRGNTYQFVDVYAKDYTNLTLGEMKADVYVNGQKLENGVYSPEHFVEAKDVEETQETVTVEYKVGEKTVYADGEPMTYILPLKTVYKKYMKKLGSQEREQTEFLTSRYFALDSGMELDLEGKSIALKTADEGTATFIQPVYSNGFKIEFDITDPKNADLSEIENTISEVEIRLTDRLDRSKQVSIFVRAEVSSTVVYINNQALAAGFVVGSLFGVSGDGFAFKYDNEQKTLYDMNKGIEIYKLTTYADGRAFEGFSDSVYVTFAVKAEQNAQSAGISITSLNGQSFSTAKIADDTFAPTVVCEKEIGGTYALGEQVVIPAGKAYDVLSNINESSFTVSVTCDGKAVKDKNGLLLQKVSATQEYIVEFTKTGKYIVSYDLKDTRGGVMPSKEFIIRIQIVQEPVIGAVELQKTVKQGGTISVPVPSVTFAEENEDNIFYIVAIEPDNQYRYLSAGEGITATKKGLYKIRYLAIDAYGNSSFAEYQVICY